MKIKTARRPYEQVIGMKRASRISAKRPNILFRTLLKLVALPDLIATRFSYTKVGMERIKKHTPCLYLMNHSSFLDLEMAVSMLYPHPVNIVSTIDGFVGKKWLMRQLGCVPTRKFVFDVGLVRELYRVVQKKKTSILMFPEAGYTFDGTAIPLPEHLAPFVKKLGVPVVMIRTFGAFSRDPLYNNLQRRKIKASAEMRYILSPEDLKTMSDDAVRAVIEEQFSFDHFRWQFENKVRIDAPFRADGLHRVLYKCPHCQVEGRTEGKGIRLTCHACGKTYTLTEYGEMKATEGDTAFSFVSDWYAWEREEVRREVAEGAYSLDISVNIGMIVDTKRMYWVGDGRLTQTVEDGLRLTGCDGKLDYVQKPLATYDLNADYNFYEIGDMISLGDMQALYYCFPKDRSVPVTKARFAAQEIYRLHKARHTK